MPDRALLDAAAKGELRTPEGLERVARTMLQDTRARQAVDEFFSQWLRFDRMLTAAKDDGRYPSFTPELAAMMVQETRMLLGHLVWNDRNFMEAFTADYSFLNADLARLYGLPEPAGEFEIVKFPEALARAGILGQATFLASTTGPVETSPTARGLFVREHLLCQIVPNPPPGVNTNLPEPSTADAARAKRERMVEHAQNPSCSGCHRLMDPIGFGLEKYDAVGAWRDQEIVDIFAGAGESRRSKPVECRHHRHRRNRGDSEFHIRRFAHPRASAGVEPRLPGMRGEADVSLCVRSGRDALGPRDGRQHGGHVPELGVQVQRVVDFPRPFATILRGV